MYQEVAFDPKCLAEYHYYGLLKSEFGFEKGRYICAPVKEWVREAYRAVKRSTQIQPNKKKSITNYLNKLQKSKSNSPITLPSYRASVEFEAWKEWCEKEIEVGPFNSIISESFEKGISYDDIIDGPDCWKLSPTLQVRKIADEIIMVIEPLIRLGGKITLIDQYFRLSDNLVLEEIIKSAIKNGSVSSITLVTAVNTANAKTVFAEQYLYQYPACPSFNIVVAPEKYFHDRYVISKFGAIKAGHGFSEGPELGAQSDSLSINLCGVEEAEDSLNKVSEVLNEGKATKLCLHEA